MGLLYSLLVTIAAIVAAPWYLVRYGLRGSPPRYWRERMGSLPDTIREDRGAGTIWIHAVSVGETLAVVGLVAQIRQRFPGRPLYLSHVTPTGRAAGERRITEIEGRFFLPLDWKWAARRIFDRLCPSMLILAETEIWPNLLRVARERKTRVILVNARLSERSLGGYRRFGFFFRRTLAAIDHVFAQTDRDAGRFRELGIAAGRITVAGNLKFDVKPPRSGDLARRVRDAFGESRRAKDQRVLVAGSTMKDEERIVLDAWDAVRAQCPQVFLIVAPRHPERFEDVAQLLAGQGRKFVRRSLLDATDVKALGEAEILLLDTIGELAGVYELADVAFVGGSLVPTSGHNPLEPAFWAKPVIFGEHMDAFRDIAGQFLTSGAAFQVRNAQDLAARTIELFSDAHLRQEMGSRAAEVVRTSAGATARVVEGLEAWLGGRDALQAAAEGQAR